MHGAAKLNMGGSSKLGAAFISTLSCNLFIYIFFIYFIISILIHFYSVFVLCSNQRVASVVDLLRQGRVVHGPPGQPQVRLLHQHFHRGLGHHHGVDCVCARGQRTPRHGNAQENRIAFHCLFALLRAFLLLYCCGRRLILSSTYLCSVVTEGVSTIFCTFSLVRTDPNSKFQTGTIWKTPFP